jgi:hypothetical protein
MSDRRWILAVVCILGGLQLSTQTWPGWDFYAGALFGLGVGTAMYRLTGWLCEGVDRG